MKHSKKPLKLLILRLYRSADCAICGFFIKIRIFLCNLLQNLRDLLNLTEFCSIIILYKFAAAVFKPR